MHDCSYFIQLNTDLLTRSQLVEFLHHGNTEIRQIGTFNRQKQQSENNKRLTHDTSRRELGRI